MIHILCFKGIRKVEESVHSLPESLEMITLDDGFNKKGSQAFKFQQPAEYEIYSGDIDRIVLDKWRPVMEDVIYSMEDTPRLVFLSERDKRLFNMMKGKLRMHTGAVDYYSLEAMISLADSADSKGEFSAIEQELKENYRKQIAEHESSSNNAMEHKLYETCSRYGMKVSFKSGTAYVSTYGGDWHFVYNDRPITLYHKNSRPVKNKSGKTVKYSHVQPIQLYSPLHALAYIRNHDAAEERRLMKRTQRTQRKR